MVEERVVVEKVVVREVERGEEKVEERVVAATAGVHARKVRQSDGLAERGWRQSGVCACDTHTHTPHTHRIRPTCSR